MTAVLSSPAVAARRSTGILALGSLGPPRLLAGLEQPAAVLDLAAHHRVHGKIPRLSGADLIEALEAVNLTGRGGAGFPLATKLRALRGRARVIVNGSESEPGSIKDRLLMRRAPHLVLDGALLVAEAVRARSVAVAVHDPESAAVLRAAAAERGDASAVLLRTFDGGFVGGEARAVARGVDGGPNLPPGRPDTLAGRGVLLANVETFAQAAVLARLGPAGYATAGIASAPGTTLLSVGGAVARPGVLEVPLGTCLGAVLDAAGAGPPRVVVLGGYHGVWLAPDRALPLTRQSAPLGAGVVLVLDDSTCLLAELAAVTTWLAGQSARQCGPCMFGLPALAQDVRALLSGNLAAAPRATQHARVVTGRGACRHPDGTTRFVSSGLTVLTDEMQAHGNGGCGRAMRGLLPLGAMR